MWHRNSGRPDPRWRQEGCILSRYIDTTPAVTRPAPNAPRPFFRERKKHLSFAFSQSHLPFLWEIRQLQPQTTSSMRQVGARRTWPPEGATVGVLTTWPGRRIVQAGAVQCSTRQEANADSGVAPAAPAAAFLLQWPRGGRSSLSCRPSCIRMDVFCQPRSLAASSTRVFHLLAFPSCFLAGLDADINMRAGCDGLLNVCRSQCNSRSPATVH